MADILNKFHMVGEASSMDIAKADDLMRYEKQELQRHKKLYELAQEDLAYVIRKNVVYPWADGFIDGAIKWLATLNTKYDKRKKYHEKDDYDILTMMLRQAFNIERIDIINIVTYSYDAYAHRVEFITDDDYVYYVVIPNTSKLTVKNMDEVYYGKLSFGYKTNSNSFYTISHSYDLTDFVSAMTEIKLSSEHDKHYSRIETGWVPSWFTDKPKGDM